MTNLKVKISNGNRKMGAIASVSLPPIKTCVKNAPCIKDCYACKLCRIYKNTRNAYEHNLTLLEEDRNNYFKQVSNAMLTERFFRYHVSGDIVDYDYLHRMVKTAIENPHCEILAFTKQYEYVNAYIDGNGELPKNLHIIFSAWPGFPMENPYNLPVSQVIFKGETPDETWLQCGGNCTECACRGLGCWQLNKGETVCFEKH